MPKPHVNLEPDTRNGGGPFCFKLIRWSLDKFGCLFCPWQPFPSDFDTFNREIPTFSNRTVAVQFHTNATSRQFVKFFDNFVFFSSALLYQPLAVVQQLLKSLRLCEERLYYSLYVVRLPKVHHVSHALTNTSFDFALKFYTSTIR